MKVEERIRYRAPIFPEGEEPFTVSAEGAGLGMADARSRLVASAASHFTRGGGTFVMGSITYDVVYYVTREEA